MKEFVSTDPRWPGKIYTDDYMNFDALIAWEDAIANDDEFRKKNPDELQASSRPMAAFGSFLKVALKVVRKWEISGLPENVTYQDFPGSANFLSFVIDCVSDLYRSTNEPDPKLQSASSIT